MMQTDGGLLVEDVIMPTATCNDELGFPARTFEHTLNDWSTNMAMLQSENPQPLEQAELVKQLVMAIREGEETRADPLRSFRFLVPFLAMVISGLIYAGIVWAKVGSMESRMSAVDSIQVIASEVVTLQTQMRTENDQIRLSQQRLEDRIEKFLDQQSRRDGAR